MKRTLIQLVGDQLDIEILQSQLRTIDWKIIKETDGYYLTSEFLCLSENVSEIVSKGKQIIDLLNGALSLHHRNHKRINTDSIVQIDEKGNRSVSVIIDKIIEVRLRVNPVVIRNGVIIEEENPSQIEDWIAIAQKHESVRDVLHFFAEITWWNLYKIYEIINDDIGGKNRIYKLGSKSKIRLFTQAAQSRELLGDHARHASKKKYPAPKTSMTIEEAYNLIKSLFENWIKLKASIHPTTET
jgi:hypothetical protein